MVVDQLLLLWLCVHRLLQHHLPLLNFLLQMCHWGINLLFPGSSMLLRLVHLLLLHVAGQLLLRSLLLLLLQAVASGCHGVRPPEAPGGAWGVTPGLQLPDTVSHRHLSL